MVTTTIGQLLVNQHLPNDLKSYDHTLDKNGIAKLFRSVAEKHPEKYREIAQKFMELGHYNAQASGASLSLSGLIPPPHVQQELEKLRALVETIAYSDMSDDKKEKKIIDLVANKIDPIKKAIYDHGLSTDNPYAIQVKSGSRGNDDQLKQLVVGDMLVQDHRDRIIPIPVLHGYAHGIDPAEYWAASYGARKGSIATKFATQDAGFFGKQLVMTTHKLVVSDKKAQHAHRHPVGIVVSAADPDNVGALLAQDVEGYKAGTILTPEILKKLGNKQLLVRSPITSHSPDGISAEDAGIREKGRLPEIGDNIGVAAAQSVGEKMAQGMLCLAGDTLVRMADSTNKCIKDIRPGEYVLGSDVRGNTRPVLVTNKFDNGTKECYSTKFKLGCNRETVELRSTLDHKILAMTSKWSCKEQILNGVARIMPVGTEAGEFSAVGINSYTDASLTYEPKALLLGLLLGDGCYTKSVKGTHISIADPVLVEDLKEYLQSLRLKLTHRSVYYYQVSRLTNSDKSVSSWLTTLGINHKYAHEKEIPQIVWTWNNQAVAELLGGLIVTDGSVYLGNKGRKQTKMYVGYGSTSRKLVEQIKELLMWRFGIHTTSVHTNPRKGSRTIYSFIISNVDSLKKFITQIPLIGIKKRKVQEWSKYCISHNNRQHFRMKRKSQESIGLMETYDIEVDHPDHLFVLANGLIVSNSTKHGGGSVTGLQTKNFGGFDNVNQLIQVPSAFRNGATISKHDGYVQKIQNAPQGGKYIYINNEAHYVQPDMTIHVKPGEKVEAGDVLSEGIVNPAEITQHKGIGEGRMAWVNAMMRGLRDSRINPHRRNLEVIARGLINHVRVTDLDGHVDALPDDIVPYDYIARTYKPREGAFEVEPHKAMNKYLEEHALHFTIGTRITPKVADHLKNFGINKVIVHNDPPPFEPEMIRAMNQPQNDPNWVSRLGGSYLERGLLQATHRGLESNTHSTSFIPSLAEGKDFAKNLKSKAIY